MNNNIQSSSPFIIIDDKCFIEITNQAIENIAPGQYINDQGKIYNSASRRFVNPNANGKNSYMYTHVYLADGTKFQIGVHRLLMLVFNYNPNYLNLQVNHKDLNKQNNSLSNLEWATAKENIEHAYLNGAMPCGESHGMSKLTEKQVEEICFCLSKGLYRGIFTNLSKKYNVDINTIYDISKGKSWQKISNKYNINYNQKINSLTEDETISAVSLALSQNRYRGQLKELSDKFNLSISVVYDIAHGNIGKDISKLYNIDYNWTPNLTEQDVENICYKLKYDKHYGQIAELAREYDVSYSTISSIANHRNWKNISDKYDL